MQYEKVRNDTSTTANNIVEDKTLKNELPMLETLKKSADKDNESLRISIISDNDDEVFCEGVGSEVKLAENLGTTTGKPHPLLPKWFRDSSDDLETVDSEAPVTPPATPVGKDELALRRHRLFSEIIDLTQHASEHRVKFDPFGPVIAGGELLIMAFLLFFLGAFFFSIRAL